MLMTPDHATADSRTHTHLMETVSSHQLSTKQPSNIMTLTLQIHQAYRKRLQARQYMYSNHIVYIVIPPRKTQELYQTQHANSLAPG